MRRLDDIEEKLRVAAPELVLAAVVEGAAATSRGLFPLAVIVFPHLRDRQLN